jgi:hypothetical protein
MVGEMDAANWGREMKGWEKGWTREERAGRVPFSSMRRTGDVAFLSASPE